MGDPPLYKNLFKRLTVLKRPRAPDTHFMWGKVAKNGQILIPNKSTFHTLRRVAETGDSAYDFPRPDDASRKPECATRVLITRPECAEHSGRSILMCAPALCGKSRRNSDVAIIWGARAFSTHASRPGRIRAHDTIRARRGGRPGDLEVIANSGRLSFGLAYG